MLLPEDLRHAPPHVVGAASFSRPFYVVGGSHGSAWYARPDPGRTAASGHRYIGQIGRTSTYPPSPSGIFLAHSSASSLVSHSIR
jgi:hypothetical protein